MIEIPAAAFAAARTMDVINALRRELGREPKDCEVRTRLGLGPVLAEAEVPGYFVAGLGGSAKLGDYTVQWDPERDGHFKMRLIGPAPKGGA